MNDAPSATLPASAGHNSGMTKTLLLDPEIIAEQLGLDYQQHELKRDELLAGAIRLIAQYGDVPVVAEFPADAKAGAVAIHSVEQLPYQFEAPTKQNQLPAAAWVKMDPRAFIARHLGAVVIPDEPVAAKATTFVKQLKTVARAVEADRTKEKAPYDGAADVVQAFFKAGIQDPLNGAAKLIEGALSAYQNRKRAEEQRRRQEEADRQREEAERVAALAARTGSDDVLDTAIQLSEQADKAERRAAAPTADLARVSGTLGGTAAALTVWKYEVVDPAKVPREYWVIDHDRLRADVKRLKGDAAQQIPGIRVWDEIQTSVR